MSSLRAKVIVALVILSLAGPFPVHSQGKPPAQSASDYPDSEDGLKRLIQDILDAVKAHDKDKEVQLIHGLLLPADTSWFRQVFGPELGESVSSDYKNKARGIEPDLRRIFENDLIEGFTNVRVRKVTDPGPELPPKDRILNDMEPKLPLYEVILTGGTQPMQSISFDSMGHGFQRSGDPSGFFFYISGQFRFITEDAFLDLPDGRPDPGHSTPRHPKILSQTYPVYPQEAKKAGVEGYVNLHLIVDDKGKVKAVTVKDGDPRLVKAAEECVRNWRFHPVEIDGKRVESEIDVSIGFQLMGKNN